MCGGKAGSSCNNLLGIVSAEAKAYVQLDTATNASALAGKGIDLEPVRRYVAVLIRTKSAISKGHFGKTRAKAIEQYRTAIELSLTGWRKLIQSQRDQAQMFTDETARKRLAKGGTGGGAALIVAGPLMVEARAAIGTACGVQNRSSR